MLQAAAAVRRGQQVQPGLLPCRLWRIVRTLSAPVVMLQTLLLQTAYLKVLQTQHKMWEVLQQHLQGYLVILASLAHPATACALCEKAERLAGNAGARQGAVRNSRICDGRCEKPAGSSAQTCNPFAGGLQWTPGREAVSIEARLQRQQQQLTMQERVMSSLLNDRYVFCLPKLFRRDQTGPRLPLRLAGHGHHC